MKRCATILGILIGLAQAPSANALRSVMIGNAPLGPQEGYGKEAMAAINMAERVILYHHDYSITSYYKGGPKAVNEMLARFAAIPNDSREIILLAGPAKPIEWGKKTLEVDYCLFVPIASTTGRGASVAGRATTLTLYIPEPLPPPLADPAQAKKCIAQLGNDDFKTRELAMKELGALGPAAAAVYREALKGTATPEAHDRIEKLLAAISTTTRLDVLRLPAGVQIVSVDSQLAKYRKDVADKNSMKRGNAARNLVHLDLPRTEVVPDLERLLRNETVATTLATVAWAAYYLGAAGKPLVPLLREVGKSTDPNVTTACQRAIEQIVKATAEVVPEAEAQRRAVIRKDIKEFVEGIKN